MPIKAEEIPMLTYEMSMASSSQSLTDFWFFVRAMLWLSGVSISLTCGLAVAVINLAAFFGECTEEGAASWYDWEYVRLKLLFKTGMAICAIAAIWTIFIHVS